MKKILALAFIGVLVLSCSKKPDHSLQDSNVMLPEPEGTTVVDSTATPAAVDQGNANVNTAAAETPAPAAMDSTATK